MATTDFTKGLAIKLTRFFVRIVGFWIWNNPREKLIMDLAMIYTIIVMIIASALTGSELWFCRADFHKAAYAAANAMTVIIIVLKMAIFLIRRKAFTNLITYCYDNFWLRDYDAFGTSVMNDCERRCVVIVGTFSFFVQCTVTTYVLHPIVESLGKNETDRILPFTIWLNIPSTTTPYYEIFFSIETFACYHTGICFLCFDNLLCIMNVYSAGQFRILQRKFELLCCTSSPNDRPDSCRKDSLNDDDNSSMKSGHHGNESSNFKDCIRNHQSLIKFTEMVEDLWTLIILFQATVFSLLICLVTYQAILVTGTSLTRRFIFIVHSTGTLLQIFMFTLTCDDLMRESEAVAEAAYCARWYCRVSDPVSTTLGKDLVLVIMRARRPCYLTAGGFFPVSLETFTTILKTSFSYLTLLRQGQAANEMN